MKTISLLFTFIISTTLLSTNIYVLPVSFNGFQVNQNGSNIELNWRTISEINNDYFVIERSTDSILFLQIGTVSGVGHSSVTVNYNFIDSTANVNQMYYYRIKQVDFDAQYSYSTIEQYSPPLNLANHDKLNFEYTFFPNPISDKIILRLDKVDEKINLIMYNIEGKEIFSELIKTKETIIDVSYLPSGAYLYNLITSKNQILATGKVFKK